MTTIGAYTAKTKLPELLRQVRKGKRFTITVRGEPVAELIPSNSGASETARTAIERMKNFKRVRGVTAEEITAWIAEGRR